MVQLPPFLTLLVLGQVIAQVSYRCNELKDHQLNHEDCTKAAESLPDWSQNFTFWSSHSSKPPPGSFITPFEFKQGDCRGVLEIDLESTNSDTASFLDLKKAMKSLVQTCVLGSSGVGRGGRVNIGAHGQIILHVTSAKRDLHLGSNNTSENAFNDGNTSRIVSRTTAFGTMPSYLEKALDPTSSTLIIPPLPVPTSGSLPDTS